MPLRLDLFVGTDADELSFLRNTGSATSPDFEPLPDPFGLPAPDGRAAPFFADVDGDGDLDLFSCS